MRIRRRFWERPTIRGRFVHVSIVRTAVHASIEVVERAYRRFIYEPFRIVLEIFWVDVAVAFRMMGFGRFEFT